MPVKLDPKVKITIAQQDITVEGPKGKLNWQIPAGISVNVAEGEVTVERATDQKLHRSLHGLSRSLIANMVTGVTQGFEKRLRVVGTGYRAEIDRQARLVLNVGYSHPVTYAPPEGVSLAVGAVETVDNQPHIPITVSGIDKELVGQVAAKIREIRKPQVYEPSKGIRYEGERPRMKEGKTGA